MNKTVEKLEKENEYLKEKEKQVKEENQLLYKSSFEDFLRKNPLFQDDYKYKNLREEFEMLEFSFNKIKEIVKDNN